MEHIKRLLDEIKKRGRDPDVILYKPDLNFAYIKWNDELLCVDVSCVDYLIREYKILKVDGKTCVISFFIYEKNNQ